MIHADVDPPATSVSVGVGEAGLSVSGSSRDRRWWSRRLWWLLGLVVLCVGAGGAWWVGSWSQSPEQAAARASEPVGSWVTAGVELRVLSATVIQRGDVVAEVAVSVGSPVSVDLPAMVTSSPPELGAGVVEGDVVMVVSGRPVFVLEGSSPMFRSLRPGMSGADVAQLQAALRRLGYAPDGDGVFGEATKVAVAAWYRDAGFDPLAAFETADADAAAARRAVDEAAVGLGDAIAALDRAGRGPSVLDVTQAESAVGQAERSLEAARAQRVLDVRLGEEAYNAAVRERDRLAQNPDSTPGELEAAEFGIDQAAAQLDATRRSTVDAVRSAEDALLIATIARDQLVAAPDLTSLQQGVNAATATKAQAEAELAAVIARNGPTVPLGEAVFVSQLPARVRSTSAGTVTDGGVGAERGSGVLVELAGGRLVVATSVRPGDVGLVRAGMDVRLLDETTAAEYAGTVASIAVDPVTAPDGQLGYPAVITPVEPLADRLVGANLRVTITAASTESAELVVPLAAVSSAADGSTRVSVVDSVNDPTPVDVEVEARLSADGFVAISPLESDALQMGDLVVVGR